MIQLSTALRVGAIFWPRFEQRDGAVLLASQGTANLSIFSSLTEAESFYNHEHVLDHFRHAIPSREHPEHGYTVWDTEHPDFSRACELGQQVAQMWLAKLRADYPTYRFRVYWSRLDEPIIRFHRVRDTEAVWIADADGAEQVERGDLLIYDSGSRR